MSFTGCEFVQWDDQKKDGRAAIEVEAGSIILSGNSFADQGKRQVRLGKNVKKAIIFGNLVAGAKNITVDDPKATVVEMGLNAFG